MSFIHNIFSNTPKKYRFTLTNKAGTLLCECKKEPLEWKEGVLQIHRDIKKGGIFTTFQVDSLTFIGNAAKKLKDMFASDGVTSEVYLHIYYFDFLTRKYIEFPGSFQGVWTLYKIVKVGAFAFGVKMEFINSGMYQKLMDRSKMNVELHHNYNSVGGYTVLRDVNEVVDLKFNAINKVNLNWLGFDSRLEDTDETYHLANTPDGDIYTTPYAKKQQTDLTGFSSVPFESQTGGTGDLNVMYTAPEDITFSVRGMLRVKVETQAISDHFKLYLNVDGVETELLSFGAVENFADEYIKEMTFGIDTPLSLALTTGQNVKVYIKSDDQTILHKDTDIFILYFYIKFQQTVASVPETDVKGKTLYNAIKKNLQLILDEQDPFKSDYLQQYPIMIASGLNLRGIYYSPWSPDKGNLATNYDDLSNAADYVLNVGQGFETIDGVEKLVMEEYAHFFDSTATVLDLSSRIGKYDIESEVIGELLYSSYKYGFEKFVYETQNGFGEYNCQHERTSVLNTDNVWEKISKLRGDTMGLIKQLLNPATITGSNDVDGDEDVFMIKVTDQTTYYLAETNEEITVVDDSSLFGDESLNLFMSPMRSFMRHGNKLSTGLWDWQSSSYLRWQRSNKNVNVITSLDGIELEETADVKINQLTAPIFKPIKHIVTCKFTKADLALLSANPYQLIKISDTISGYLLDIKMKNKEDRATIEIIEKA